MARDVGTIYVNLFLRTKDAFRQLDKATESAGERAADQYGEAFEKRLERKKFDRLYNRWARSQRGPVERIGDSLGGLFAVAWGRGLTRQGRLWYRAIVTLLEPATQLVFGLAGAAGALAGTLGSASLATGSLVPVFASLGAAGLTLAVGFAGITGEVEDMTPAMRNLVTSVKELLPEWESLKEAVQEPLFAGLGDSITSFVEESLPALRTGMADIATVINEQFTILLESLSGDRLGNLFSGLSPILEDVLAAFNNLIVGVLGFTEAALPAANRTSQAFAEMANRWAEFTNSTEGQTRIADALERAQDRASALLGLLDPLAGGFRNIFSIGAEEGDRMVVSLTGLFERFEAWTESVAGQTAIEDFFRKSSAALEAFSPALEGLAKGLNAIFNDRGIANLERLSEGLGQVLEVVGELFAALGQTQILAIFGDVLGLIADVVTPLLPSIEKLANILGSVLNQAFADLAPIIMTVVEALVPFVETLVEALGPVLQAILPVLTPIAEAFGDLAVQILALLEPLLVPLGELLATLAPVLVQLFIAFNPVLRVIQLLALVIEPLSPLLETVIGWLADLITWVTGLIKPFVGVIATVVQFIGSAKAFNSIIGVVGGWLSKLGGWLGQVFSAFSRLGDAIRRFSIRAGAEVGGFVTRVGQFFQNFRQNVLNIVNNVVSGVVNFFRSMKDKAVAFVRLLADDTVSFFRSMPGRIMGFISSIPGRIRGAFSDMPSFFGRLVDGIVRFFVGLPGRILGAIGNVGSRILSSITGSIPAALRKFLPFAEGGIVFGPTRALIGEAGPEAVIPLTRPLSQVDPSVRDMAAQLRGEGRSAQGASPGGRVYNVTMNVYPASGDPAAIAAQVMNRMTVLAAS